MYESRFSSVYKGLAYYHVMKLIHLDKKYQNDLLIFSGHGTGLALIIGR